jgi:hypothetical protein
MPVIAICPIGRVAIAEGVCWPSPSVEHDAPGWIHNKILSLLLLAIFCCHTGPAIVTILTLMDTCSFPKIIGVAALTGLVPAAKDSLAKNVSG